MGFWELLLAVGIPSAIASGVIGLLFKRIDRRLKEEEGKREKQAQARREFEQFEVQSLTAVISLCEANATALQNGHCNGETHAALEYLKKVKHEQRDFLVKNGIEHIF